MPSDFALNFDQTCDLKFMISNTFAEAQLTDLGIHLAMIPFKIVVQVLLVEASVA